MACEEASLDGEEIGSWAESPTLAPLAVRYLRYDAPNRAFEQTKLPEREPSTPPLLTA